MAKLKIKNSPLTINPLKVSQSVGASLAFLGLANCMPLQHGARGCTSFNKLFFMRHFREPIPLQTTAMELTAVIMGADKNVIEALRTICDRYHPEFIGLSTTGLTATQGVSLTHSVAEFRTLYPQFNATAVIKVNTCDSQGGLEIGYQLALRAVLDYVLPEQCHSEPDPSQVNVLVSPLMTPRDIDVLKEWIESFGLTPIVLPDISTSLGGSLMAQGFMPLTQSGTCRQQIEKMVQSCATLVIGASLFPLAEVLQQRTGAPSFRFNGLHGLRQCDAFNRVLQQISGEPVPQSQCRGRQQLQDAMLDCQFRLGVSRIGIGVECDLLLALAPALEEVGAELSVVVIPSKPIEAQQEALNMLNCETIQVADLGELEHQGQHRNIEVLISNSHGQAIAQHLQIGLLPAGYPLHRHAGGHARQWIGYEGSRQLLYSLDNLLAQYQHLLSPYHSKFWPQRAV
ncbi:nitrogenase iron-molybdenum cofactor biosynthesis protein NifN [Celerinatantimonas sp. YJH-8]|uniref:nitrogenase iron-molybdenum cofactor biosynthesis protein NifN n=1 Tax=Celerinatantimonas sp. YJH-8 TaxID=3228714 RepID=UPI0038CA54EB